MSEPRSLLLVGKVRPERKRSLTGMAVAADLPLVAVEDPVQALEWLEANEPGCLVVDAGVGRLDKLIAKLRSKRHLTHVPVFSLVSAPDDLWIEQYFGWGGDDVVHVDAGSTLLDRLRAVPREPPQCNPNRHVVIGDPEKARTEVLGRSFAQAGFDAKSAIDRKSLEFFIQQRQPQLVIANCILGELPELIARSRQNGSTASWIVLCARRELEAQQLALGAIDRCAVLGVQVNPWQLLYRANELARESGDERRREARRAFGSFVLFRAAGSDDDDVGVAFNLSSRGMFVRTFAPVLSEDVWLEWRVPQDKTRVRLEGRVVWRQASLTDPERAASPMGFGVEFCDYLGGARKHLERALEVLDAGTKRTSGSSPIAMSGGSNSTQSRDSIPPPVDPVQVDPVQVDPVQVDPAQVDRVEPLAVDKTKNLPVKSESTRPSALPPAVVAKPAPRKTGAVAPPAAKSALPKSSTPGTVGPRPSVRPLTNLGGMSRSAASTKAEAISKPPAAAKDKSKPVAAGTSERSDLAVSQAVTKRLAPPPAGKPVVKSLTATVKGPPRPMGAPPRPERGMGTDAGGSAKAVESVGAIEPVDVPEVSVNEQAGEVKERRFDTLRNAQAFDDLVEATDPDARRELLDDGPTSSEPTEILANPSALFDGVEGPKQPLCQASDDAPTVVVESPRLTAGTGSAPEEEPPSARVAESFFGAEEQVTQQWHAQAEAEAGIDLEDEVFRPKRKRGGVLVVVGFVLVAATLAGVGLWLRASGAASKSQSPRLPSAKPSNVAAASSEVPLAASVAQVAGTAPDAAAPEASGSASADGIPWAKPDDGTGLENYPPIEDPQGGRGRLLADKYGYLVVRFPEAAYLFSNNIAVGATNWKIAFPCGEKVLRVGVGEKPVIWLSNETRVNVECRGLTRVVFDRLPGVVAPPGVQRPIAPGSQPGRKASDKDSEEPSTESAPAVEPDHGSDTRPEKKPVDPYGLGTNTASGDKSGSDAKTGSSAKQEPKPAEGERGVVDTRE